MSIPMNRLQRGQSGRILKLLIRGDLRRRLFDLGLIPGTHVERIMTSPAGDPVCFRVRGALIALRGSDAALVRVAV